MAQQHKISIAFPSSLQYLDALQGVAENLATVAGFGDEGRLDVGLAVREGAINAMKHGNRLDPEISVQLRFALSDKEIRITITDQGEGFVPEETPDPTTSENLWRSSGRGLLLIRSLVDEVSFKRKKTGMELTLAKKLAGSEVDEEAS